MLLLLVGGCTSWSRLRMRVVGCVVRKGATAVLLPHRMWGGDFNYWRRIGEAARHHATLGCCGCGGGEQWELLLRVRMGRRGVSTTAVDSLRWAAARGEINVLAEQ